jgi:branched-chain amino acid transport system substrate-binding protein
MGPQISDNSLAIQDRVYERRSPVIAWTGAWRFSSEYCFTIANGDVPTERVTSVQWTASRGHRKVGLFWAQGSSGRHYAEFFREECDRLGLTIARDVKLGSNPQSGRPLAVDARGRGSRRSTTAATATPPCTSPRRSRSSTGTLPA